MFSLRLAKKFSLFLIVWILLEDDKSLHDGCQWNIWIATWSRKEGRREAEHAKQLTGMARKWRHMAKT